MFQEDDYVNADVTKHKRSVVGRDVKSRRKSNDVVTPSSPKRNIVNQLDVVGRRKRKLVTSSVSKGEGHCFNPPCFEMCPYRCVSKWRGEGGGSVLVGLLL